VVPLLWDSSRARVDVVRDREYLLARVLEFGTMRDVRWLLKTYGASTIHDFFRHSAHPELSPRTIAFWRAWFDAEDETWRSPPTFRRSSSSSWLD
jgi:hypothetical protein